MKSFRYKLTSILILIIGCAIGLTGLFVTQLMDSTNKQILKKAIENELEVVVSTQIWANRENTLVFFTNYTQQIKSKTEHSETRLTFIDANGSVIADSDSDSASMENHLNRPEIVQARNEGIGYAQRFSQTLKENMLYVAIPIQQNGQVIGYLRGAKSMSQITNALHQLWVNLVIGLGFMFSISVIASYRIAKTITKPIETISAVAKRITQGRVEERIRLSSQDEISELANEINQMADSLQLQMNMIRENESRLSNVLVNMISGIIMIERDQKISLVNPKAEEMIGFRSDELVGRRYTETKQPVEFKKLVERALRATESIREEMLFFYPAERVLDVHLVPIHPSRDVKTALLIVLHDVTALRKLERMRSEFVANVSHELKTPLSVIKGFSETLLAGALDNQETARSFLQIIYDESERLNRLIMDVLDLSKIESKRIPLQFTSVPLLKCVQDIFQSMHSEAQKKNIRLEMEIDESLIIEADGDCLRQILLNLIANAITYNSRGGKVLVTAQTFTYSADSVQQVTPWVHIIVKDTGVGIPKKDIPRIFERFYRVDEARLRISGGTGLGLSIVKHLVELHHGTVRVESQVGIGTKFIIEMPLVHQKY